VFQPDLERDKISFIQYAKSNDFFVFIFKINAQLLNENMPREIYFMTVRSKLEVKYIEGKNMQILCEDSNVYALLHEDDKPVLSYLTLPELTSYIHDTPLVKFVQCEVQFLKVNDHAESMSFIPFFI